MVDSNDVVVEMYLHELAIRLTQAENRVEPLEFLRSSLGRRLKPKSATRLERMRLELGERMLPAGIVPARVVDSKMRWVGTDYPQTAATMVGVQRLVSLGERVVDVVRNGVPGDLVETGVWRGGASLFMRAALRALGDKERKVVLADSFAGLPKPGAAGHTQDKLNLSEIPYLAVSREQVEQLFRQNGLLDAQVEFLEGWFHETLPSQRGRPFALIRLDGDLYSSTMIGLENLYPSLTRGGCIIIDDFGIEECQEAVADFRREHKIEDPLVPIDESSVWWRKI